MEARNSFSTASDAYARARPHYPTELFQWMAAQCSERRAAWDCATGNGQAAIGLARHFEIVHATDISAAQVASGFRAANIVYEAQPAERTGFAPHSFDLVAVAQALHWFHFGRFWPEVRRVAKPGAFFCAWGYSWFEGGAEVQERLVAPLLDILDPYWAPNNRILWSGYQSEDIAFPFERVEMPRFAIELRWEIAQLLDYIRTWSAWKRALGEAPVAASLGRLEAEALSRFAAVGPLRLTMPISGVAGRVA